MKILTRYILFELIKWFVVALSALTLIIAVFGGVREGLQYGLPPAQVLGLIPYGLPWTLCLAVPGTLLLATTTVYGRLAGWNEVVAIKSQGISPRKILEPLWALAFVVSVVMVFVNDLAASCRNDGRRYVVESVVEIAYGMLRTKGQYSSPRFSIHVKGVEDRKLIRPNIVINGSGDAPTLRITAEEAEMQSDREQGDMKLILRDGRLSIDGRTSVRSIDDTLTIPLQEASQAGGASEAPSWLALRVISKEVVRQEAAIERCKKTQAAQAACQMLCGDFETLTGDEWKTNAAVLRDAENRLCRLEAEPHRRWAAGFSCLCFAFVGAPMAIRLRNRDLLTSFFLCFLPILIVYYPLLVVGIDGAKDGRLPPWSVWAGNILLLLWGAYLLRRVLRY
ncbi:MAG: LptF/LptG family permease [Planctomycetia bacterium]|nr:LptF/LptG family permease [Planctomycetia bacterium]